MQRILIAIAFIFLISANLSHAQTNPLYTAEILVDVTADNASIAREKAMSQANRKAFLAIAARLTTASNVSSLSQLTDKQILNFIKEVSIISEKASDVRYIANLNVVVNENIFKDYMREKSISYAVGSNANILVIPTFREFSSDKPVLWEDNNPWRKAWEEKPHQQGLITFLSLPNNPENISAINADQALSFDGIALDKVGRLNGSADIYVADATYNGIEGLNITLRSYRNGTEETISVMGDRSPQLFEDAITEVTARINSKMKQQDIVDSQQKLEITVLYKYNNIGEWIKLEKDLKTIGIIDLISVDAIGNGKVQFKIHFVGSEDKLLRALRDKYYNLKNFGSFYNIEKI